LAEEAVQDAPRDDPEQHLERERGLQVHATHDQTYPQGDERCESKPERIPWAKASRPRAIFRARQYIYAAARRGYFEPYEFELYTRLKEHLYLTDEEARNLFKLPIPREVLREVVQVESS